MPNKNIGILVIDKDNSVVKVIDSALAARGFGENLAVCPTIRDSKQHLETCKTNDDLAVPQVILLEILLSDGSGLDLLEFIRNDEILHSAAVFILTKSKQEEDREKAFQFNVAGYVHKQDDQDQLRNDINRMLDYWEICEFI